MKKMVPTWEIHWERKDDSLKWARKQKLGKGGVVENIVFIHSTFSTIVLRRFNAYAAFPCHCWFFFCLFKWGGKRACRYAINRAFWEVNVQCLILRWLFRPVDLLLFLNQVLISFCIRTIKMFLYDLLCMMNYLYVHRARSPDWCYLYTDSGYLDNTIMESSIQSQWTYKTLSDYYRSIKRQWRY